MRDNKVVNWGAELAVAQFTLNKKDTFFNSISIQKSDKVYTYSTSFLLADGTWLRTLDGAAGSWGYGIKPLGGNEFEQPLPDKVRITYLDEVANQYYQSEHDLPKERIYELMTDRHRNKHHVSSEEEIDYAYDNIELAFTPNGWVIVFVTGWSGRREVVSFQVTPIDPNPKTIEGEALSGLDEVTEIYYEEYQRVKLIGKDAHMQELTKEHPEMYELWKEGKWKISSDWYKKMQTKYPWNLSVEIDGHEWDGEYYAEFVNAERYAVFDDQFETHYQELKGVPSKIQLWVKDKDGVRKRIEVLMYPRPRWTTRSIYYHVYYKDPNAEYFAKRFAHLYPKRSLATNQNIPNQQEFAQLKLVFNKELILQDAYLQKGADKLPLDGVYQFDLAPIDMDRNGGGAYAFTLDGYPKFITEPKIKDLSDPAFVDID